MTSLEQLAKSFDHSATRRNAYLRSKTALRGQTEEHPALRLGLCCAFQEQPIKFVNTTVRAICRMDRPAALAKISRLCLKNAEALLSALEFCAGNGIGAFRVNSQILPVKTHSEAGYDVSELPDAEEIIRRFKACGEYAKEKRLRTSFHPDQFVVLSSPREEVVKSSLAELEYQNQVAEWIGADVINIHAGGAYGDKQLALRRFVENVERLSDSARSRLTLENDDTTYTVEDLLPLCHRAEIPLVFDVHHHRCLHEGMSVEEATELALETWNREPLLHISSPQEGWQGTNPRRHHDYIDVNDFPTCWRGQAFTVDVEARAKELAVLKLQSDLQTKPPQVTRARIRKG